ncbi:hypothetical protein E4T66_01565 [Sinimarinibacterium sp. CAU 1509]|uniref:hypothetical protein n=1 Tax=Sinimarinibacterium sp. CAU 1509 TaxID=2562283 RepID=UPI0010AC0EF2|nr:hypothetical protein [Sinimarinibacterium sp. CAU 1509]TJY64942.1 hypothetical protein E4T66_01565 [Sinimarinibacterium sp. CAU 1509]
MISSLRACWFAGAALILAATVVACDGVGSGAAPTRISISYGDSKQEYQTFECAAFALAANAHFSGSAADSEDSDISSRARWRSSNPGVIDVSNGDIEAEPGSGTVFPAGTVIVRGPGSAVIRADYIGLSASFSVSARPISGLRMTPELTRMAPSSSVTFALYVTFAEGDEEYDLTSSAIWSLATIGAPADLSGSMVKAVSDPLDQPFVLEARLFTCERSVSRTLQLGAVRELQISYEQSKDLALPLAITDEVRVAAVFDDTSAPNQDLSAQLEIEQVVGAEDDAAIGVGQYLTVNGYKEGMPSQFRLRYEPLNLSVLTRVYSFADLKLRSLRVSPSTALLSYPDTLQLQAYGMFDDGYERPVRRSVSWSSLDSELASVTTGTTDAGLVTPAELLGGNVSIRAYTANSEGSLTSDAEIGINMDN